MASPIPLLKALMAVLALLTGVGGTGARAGETRTVSGFTGHFVEFQNQNVKLAGSLLLPERGAPVPAVVFVHGAGPQTRESYREAGEYFAGQGIAALIYDKRGTGGSGGAYESREPYSNLVNDALAAVSFLKQHRGIESAQIGIWGLSQGAWISAAAASRSGDIRFIIAAGADVSDGMMFYYRDNLFRKYRLSGTLRDVAEKGHLAQWSLPWNVPDKSPAALFAPRTYPPPDQYVHPAWSRVKQPVLAMWGQLDQHVPVGESVAGLKHSLALAGNPNWTFVILPQAKHSLGISETGGIQEAWRGYAPGALKRMTDWVHGVIGFPRQTGMMKQEGAAAETGVLARMVSYEKLRWYGNGTVQATLWVLFLIGFLPDTIAGFRGFWRRLFRHGPDAPLPASGGTGNFKRTICALNLLILVAFTVMMPLVLDQMHPGCPAVLLFLPLLGSVSTIATVVLLILPATTRRDMGWPAEGRVRAPLRGLCLILFVPFLYYWNLTGLHF